MKRLLLFTLILSACTTTPTAPQPTPAKPEQPVHTLPVPNPPAEPVTPPVVVALDFDKILKANPACVTHSFAKRGVMPYGFAKGVAMAYATSMKRYNSDGKTPAGVMGQELNSKIHSSGFPYDVLFNYKLASSNGGQRIKQVYTILFGLGMRESSGNYGEGRDENAGFTKSDEAETGLFQFSYNLNKVNAMLDVLYKGYQAHPENCNVETFKVGVKKPFNTKYWGDGAEGLAFQKFARSCPAFATEYTALGLRVLEPHWGPARRKEAEYVPACEQMLSQIELALSHP